MAADYKEQKCKCGDDAISKAFPDYEVVAHRIGNQTDAVDNHNKFFSLELHKCSNGQWRVYSNYGRVSDEEYTGVVGVYGPDDESSMRAFFESKFKSKVRPSKGYQEIKFIRAKVGSPKARAKVWSVDANEIPDEKKKKIDESAKKDTTVKKVDIHPQVARLVNQWYSESSKAIQANAAVTITSDGIETPLGVLTFSQLEKGKKLLGEIGEALKNKDDKEVKRLSGAFYTHVPTKLGRKISDEDLITTDVIIQQKLDLIDMMADALEVGGAAYVSDVDKKYLELGVKFEFLDKGDVEWKRVEHLVKSTRGHNHYGTTDKVLNVLRAEIPQERVRYAGCKIGNEKELFHGSRNCNQLGILKSGLKIAPPEAPVTGYMFGKGIYAADSSTKSINYSLLHFPGAERAKNCFLFLGKMRCGKQLKLEYSDSYADRTCKKAGCDSTMGVKGPSLIHNEYICYTTEQFTITHIVELER